MGGQTKITFFKMKFNMKMEECKEKLFCLFSVGCQVELGRHALNFKENGHLENLMVELCFFKIWLLEVVRNLMGFWFC